MKMKVLKILNIDGLGFSEYEGLKFEKYCFDLDFDYSENPEKYKDYELVSYNGNVYNIKYYIQASKTFMDKVDGKWDDDILLLYIDDVVKPSMIRI